MLYVIVFWYMNNVCKYKNKCQVTDLPEKAMCRLSFGCLNEYGSAISNIKHLILMGFKY